VCVVLLRLKLLIKRHSCYFNKQKQHFMKRTWCFLIALLGVVGTGFSQSKGGVFVSDAVQPVAQQMKVDYKGLVRKASAKDTKALNELFEFTRMLDGNALSDHMITCLELIPVVTDAVYAKALESRSAGLKAYMLSFMEIAQQKTQKQHLKKPIKEWAPYTWDALNGREVNITIRPAESGKPSATSPTSPTMVAPDAGQMTKPGSMLAPDASKGNSSTAPASGRRGN